VSSLRPVAGPPAELLRLLREWDAADAEPDPLVVETSGSTGEPKRVVLSRRAMRASATATHSRLGGPGSWLLTLPATYVAGLQVLFRSVVAGTAPVVLDDHVDLAGAVGAMPEGRRYVSLVPTQLRRLLADHGPDADTLRTFDVVLLGGAALAPSLREAAGAAGVTVVATYGMSETCGGCVYDGRPLDGVRIDLTDDARIRLTGPMLFEGYLDEPERTAEVLQDGWFLTSDVGRLDGGELQVLDRVDDVVISGGVNVPTSAVARRLEEHPAITHAAVVGAPDEEWGQVVVALVETTEPHVETATLRDFVAERHPRTWAPRHTIAAATMPLLPNGKVDRRAVQRIVASSRRTDDERREGRR